MNILLFTGSNNSGKMDKCNRYVVEHNCDFLPIYVTGAGAYKINDEHYFQISESFLFDIKKLRNTIFETTIKDVTYTLMSPVLSNDFCGALSCHYTMANTIKKNLEKDGHKVTIFNCDCDSWDDFEEDLEVIVL